MRRRCLLALFIFTLSACSIQPPVDPGGPADPQPPQTVSPAGEPSPAPATATSQTLPSPTPASPPAETAAPLPQYMLSATLDYARHLLTVEEHIRYTNRTGEALPDLLLVVEPIFYPGVFNLQSLAWDDGQAVEGYTWENTRLRLPLRSPLEPAQGVGLTLIYELRLPSPVPSPTTRPVPFGYTERQTNLVDWYPFIPPYIPGQGWLVHDPGYFGEHLVYEISNFRVEFRLVEPAYGGQPLTVAASAPAGQEGEAYRYRLDAARNFVLSVSHLYQVFTQTVGTVTVSSYYFPLHVSAGEAVLQTTARALDLYGKLFGPYPRPTLAVVEADFLDGMEYEGLYFLSKGFYNLYQGTPGELLIAIAAHETAHQWWYARVGNDQALEPWLDEALCTYSERIYYENVAPAALEWWWAYRVNYYEPSGPVDGSIYNPGGFRPYRDAVYLNGAVFLEALRGRVGEIAFFATLRDYAALYSGKIATGPDFFGVLKEHTDVDFGPVVEEFFQNPPE